MTAPAPILQASRSRAEHARAILTPPLLLLGPLFHQLRSHEYPLLGAEVLLVAAATAIVGLLTGVAIDRARPAFRLPSIALLLAFVWDLYVFGGSFSRMAIVMIATLVAVWVLREHISTIAFAISLPLLASTLLPPIRPVTASTRTWQTAPLDSGLPPIFHFVLDEHGGLAGLAEDAALVRDLTAWYEGRGFRLFPNAYSPYFDTYNALPNLLNFTSESKDGFYFHPSMGEPSSVQRNRFFERLRARGYDIRVYQSDYIDFCDAGTTSVSSCFTYPANSLTYAADMDLPPSAHARLLANYFLANQSWLFGRLVAGYRLGIRPALAALGMSPPPRDWRGDRVGPPAEAILARIEHDLSRGTSGTLFFAHLLMPHYPYQYDAQCRVNARGADRLERISPNAPAGMDNTPASRARRLELYGGQTRCLMRQLSTFFATLDSLGVYSSATIVLHGDHGPRIGLRRPQGRAAVARLTRQDVLDAYSTLLAVKAPGMSAAADSRTIAIADALAALVEGDLRSVDHSADSLAAPSVFAVITPGGRMMPIDYPSGPRRPDP